MKKKFSKKILITTLLFALFLISITTVNATDVHMNSTNNTIINAVVNGTGSSGGTIYLADGIYKNSHLNGSNGIIINKNMIIIGESKNNVIIDAQNSGRIFYIRENSTVTFININFINSKTSTFGGAIYHQNGTMTIINCSFIDNNGRYGGAIDNDSNNTRIINCIFINNNASFMGGAILNYGRNMSVINSTFINNNATNNGGGIYNYGGVDMTVTNSTFIYNSADFGGAICINGYNTKISNSSFTNNTANYGSAIYNHINHTIIIDSSFIDNDLTTIYNVEALTISNSNLTQNVLAVYSEGNITIKGCNIIDNYQGILINSTSNNTNINYNRIFNNTEYDLNTNVDINVNMNWWGNNTPTKIIGIIPNNYFVMRVSNLTSLDSNGTVTFKYAFKLNNSDSFDVTLLPYFVTDVYTNLTGGVITSFDARFDKTFDGTVNTSGAVLYTFVTDNEVQTLEGNTIIPIPPEPPIPPIPPEPTPDQDDPVNPDKPKTNDNPVPVSAATMKTTGIPIITIFLVLLTSLGLIIGKKQN